MDSSIEKVLKKGVLTVLFLLTYNHIVLPSQIGFDIKKDMDSSIKKVLKNVITTGAVCNHFGSDTYVQNNDSEASYSVTIKVYFFQIGTGNTESQEIVVVPAGGKYYLGCSVGIEAGSTYSYNVVGERKI